MNHVNVSTLSVIFVAICKSRVNYNVISNLYFDVFVFQTNIVFLLIFYLKINFDKLKMCVFE